ncbi:multicopper oxidase [Pyrenophora seminiperda CCB06]|uniref:Multicopper oxidase n=1 Tax=Pyrenophora seminiperda CCB06 TaxID=1302712 RepID=A0A3M7LW75_9PLEO|nr:multicopper oxidase [Pyrenophora seminiperda CCB06]
MIAPTTNAHGHGGPYYNPYNDVPLPFDWPGIPSEGEMYPPPQPPIPYSYGGPAKDAYHEPCWIPKGIRNLTSSISHVEQSGNSNWGLIDCPRLPVDGLPDSHSNSTSPTSSFQTHQLYPHPTGSGRVSYSANTTNIHSNRPIHSHVHMISHASTVTPASTPTADPSCPVMPDTGVTRTYDLHVAYQTIAPDGVTKNGLTVNGQFPGPLVEANWGDWILWRVTNELTDEGTTLHAHGLLQMETPWYDGVPAVGQCPITPNGGYYEMLFRADRYGSSWYHSHYSAQYSGGAHGPIVIHGPKHEEYDIDVGPVMLEDWFHADYYTLVNNTMNGRFPPSNNNLINGRMNYPCDETSFPCTPNAGISKFRFESGKKHLLRLVNTGAEGNQKFSIDGHMLKVVALDFIPVEPYMTNVVTLAIGQRTDVIVEAIGNPGDTFWMRSQLAQGFRCTLTDGISPNALAAVYYEDADTDAIPESTSDVTQAQLEQCKNDPITLGIPLCKIPVEEPDHIEQVDMVFQSNGSHFVWFMNDSPYHGDYNAPTLLKAKLGESDFKPEWNVYEFPDAKHVRIVLVNHGLIGGHPMHLHGHDFHVLAEGYGEWDGVITNSGNTIRRDTHLMGNARITGNTREPSYMVIQYVQDNPGVWPLHCHLAWHVSGGLFMQILENVDEIKNRDFGEDLFDLCDSWDAYSAVHILNQIDSGQ